MNRQLNKQETIKVLAIAGVCLVTLLGVSFAWQRMQTNSSHKESLRVQALEMGHSPEAAEGSGPIEQESQQSDPNFVP